MNKKNLPKVLKAVAAVVVVAAIAWAASPLLMDNPTPTSWIFMVLIGLVGHLGYKAIGNFIDYMSTKQYLYE
ncbi:hypothetical protein [Arthrobacter sp. RAF14]|uniref:hypothetical protein n=1 Tax=Arthrobacter sp. RAF14 TaxID=3233051 RepID=UPI003F92E084